MEIIGNIFLIILTLIGLLPLMLFIFLEKKDRQSISKKETTKDYIKEYLKKYNTCKLVEINSKIKKVDETQKMPQPFVIILIIFLSILMYSFKYFIRENFFIGFVICVIFVFGGLVIFLLTKKPTIKNIVLKNNVIELCDSNDEIKTYELDRVEVKYNIHSWHSSLGLRSHKYINIYFNEDKYTSNEFNIYNFEHYIAFVIFINFLKRNELEKINNLNDEDIKRLQQGIKYNEELEI